MAVLVFQHVPCEGPGYIGDFFAERSVPIRTVALFAGDPIPDPLDYEALVVMGGPMNVYQEREFPFLAAENRAIQRAVGAGVPYLGICLGAQLLAKALGAPVRPNPVKEIGFAAVQLTPAGQQDPLFAGLAPGFEVFQWHGDTFDIPAGGAWLATSPACRHQAFRYRDRAYGLQFHVETPPEMVKAWIAEYQEELRLCGRLEDAPAMAAEAEARATHLRQQTVNLLANFWDGIVMPAPARVRGFSPAKGPEEK